MIFWQTFLSNDDALPEIDQVKAAVEYQLIQLFTAEAPLIKVPRQLLNVEQSNFCFGLQSVQSISSQMNGDEFSRYVEKLVVTFEPRLTNVSVEVSEHDEQHNRINFSLTAVLKTEQGPRAIEFESKIDLTGQNASMEGHDLV